MSSSAGGNHIPSLYRSHVKDVSNFTVNMQTVNTHDMSKMLSAGCTTGAQIRLKNFNTNRE